MKLTYVHSVTFDFCIAGTGVGSSLAVVNV